MVDLIGKSKYFFVLSIIILIAGITMFFMNGFVLDIQFQGGTVMNFKMPDANFDADKAVGVVENAIGKVATASKQQAMGTKVNLLSVSIASADTLSESELFKVQDEIIKAYNLKRDADTVSTQNIAPFIGKEIMGNGVKAVIISSLLIILYIWYRFKIMSGLSAGVMAVIGLLHDVAMMLTVYLIFRIPLNESFIAAVLTILGYSMNDTIIIYDRIRENSGLLRKTSVTELANKSILQTLVRSINTEITVLISVATVYVFARMNNIASIEDFAFPLLIGLISGCYSTLFITSPLWVMWKEYQAKKKITVKTAKA